jgi:hypothetical protein
MVTIIFSKITVIFSIFSTFSIFNYVLPDMSR